MKYLLREISTEQFKIVDKRYIEHNNKIAPLFNKKIIKLNDDNYMLKLQFILKDKEEYISPLDIDLVIHGVFTLKDFDEDQVNKFMNNNAIQILFPYLRSTLSSAMAALMIPPLYIPIMDSRNIFKD